MAVTTQEFLDAYKHINPPADLKGETGHEPAHEWNGTQLRFQNPDESWGNFVDLKGETGDVNLEQLGGVSARVTAAEKSIASILASNPSGSPVIAVDTYSDLSLPTNAADAWMKAGLSGMTVTNLVDGEGIADSGTVTFASINGNKYYESLTPAVVTGTGSDITLTNSSGVTKDIHVINLNSIGLEAISDVPTLTAMFPHYIDGTVSTGGTRFTSKDEDDNIVSVSYFEDLPLRRLPNGTKDTVERKADGTWKRVQRVGKVTLSSGINWAVTDVNDTQAVYLADSGQHNYSSALPNAYTWHNLGGHFMVTTSSGQAVNTVSYAGPDQRTSANIGSVYGGRKLFGMIFAVGTFATTAAAKVHMEANPIIVYYQLATPIETDLAPAPALSSKPNGTVVAEPAVCDVGAYGTGITVSGKIFSSIGKVTILNLVDGTEEDVTADCTLTVGADGFTCSSASAKDYLWYELLVDTSTVANPEKNYQYFDNNVVNIDSVDGKVYKVGYAIASGVISLTKTELV